MDIGEGEVGDIPTRPMRVKILYTFDREHKDNCLARFQDVLQIPAVAIDESSEVGVIELKQCLDAIVGASPELVSRLTDGDFTIYAYDYSEYDTPLVGQGMLSAALSSASPGQNKSMITGRVCKNKFGLFSNGVKETLEVKLRLVPVRKQNDFSKGVDGFRSNSPAVSGGFDPNAWNASMQHTKSVQANDYFDLNTMMGGNGAETAFVNDIFGLGSASSGSASGQQLVGGVGIAETPSNDLPGFNPAFAAHPHSAPGSRAGSPMMGSESSTRNDLLRHQSFSGNPSTFISEQSRPGSRASARSEVEASAHPRQDNSLTFPFQSQNAQQTEVHYNEDGQPRKRAKVQQTDWHGRSSFGSKSADLRVTAATAASMHMHRPIPRRSAAPGSNLEPPPRVPTPVPQRTQILPQQQIGARRSMLRQASQADSDFMSDVDAFSDAIVSSPDEDSPGNSITAEGTPQEIPSSPPVFTGIHHPQPSSPGLPTLPLPRMADSGYMSERGFPNGNIMESMEHDSGRTPNDYDSDVVARYRARSKSSHAFVKVESDANDMLPSDMSLLPQGMNIEMEVPGDPNQLPQKMLLNLPPRPRREESLGPRSTSSKRSAPTEGGPTSRHSRAPSMSGGSGSRRGSLALPPPSSDFPDSQVIPKAAPRRRQGLSRSRTTSNESEAGSPAPSDNEGGRPRGPGRSGSGAQRRKQIEERLKTSIANGAVPQFCTHCGAIETPTWRRVYVKECEGKPSPLDEAEGEGETIGVEITEVDDKSGEATKFLIRKSMKKTKDNQPGAGFEELVVCNPCGLWFIKYKNMRPPEKWGRKSVARKSKKQRATEDPGMFTDNIEPQSDIFFTDQMLPDDTADDADAEGDTAELPQHHPRSHGYRPRANSLQAQQRRPNTDKGQWNASQLDAALAREVQSSPARFQGSQASPIELEDRTPRPTRRLLFPSPRKEGEVKSLDDNAQVSLKAMPQSDHTMHDKSGFEFAFGDTNTNVFEAFTFEKENMMPPLANGVCDDDLAHLFDGSPSAFFKTPFKSVAKNPTTPRSKRQSQRLTTPTTSRGTKRKPLTPNANAANNANLNHVHAPAHDFMTSPSSSRYFLRSTPSRVERNTPGRLSSGSKRTPSNGVSPWSRHLAQMLSDANDSNQFTSPSKGGFDFSDLPTFNTPGRDWETLDGILSSDFAGFGDDALDQVGQQM